MPLCPQLSLTPSSYLHLDGGSEPVPSTSGSWPQRPDRRAVLDPGPALDPAAGGQGANPQLLSTSGGPTCAAKGNASPCLRVEVSAKERKRRVSLRIEGSSPLEVHGSQALLLFPLALSPQPPTVRPRAILLGGEHCKRSPCPALEGFQHCHIRRNRALLFASCVTLSELTPLYEPCFSLSFK